MLTHRVKFGDREFLFDAFNMDVYEVDDPLEAEEFESQMQGALAGEAPDFGVKAENGHLSQVVINMATTCNLRCEYCYAGFGQYGHNRPGLLGQAALDRISADLTRRCVSSIGTVELFGGEPLSNSRLMSVVMNLFQERFGAERFEITTNGSLVTSRVSELMARYPARVFVSIDGPEDINDRLRGIGTYRRAMEALGSLRAAGVEVAVSSTFTKRHVDAGISKNDVIEHFERLGYVCSITSVLTDNKDLAVSATVGRADMVRDIREAIETLDRGESRQINVYLAGVLKAISTGRRNIGFCDDLTTDLCVAYDVDGGVYNCFHFWGDEGYQVGPDEKISHGLQEINRKTHSQCQDCWSRYLCNHCTANLVSGVADLPVSESGCAYRDTFELCLDELAPYFASGGIARLVDGLSGAEYGG